MRLKIKTIEELWKFKIQLEEEINKISFKGIKPGFLISDYLEGQLFIESSSKINRKKVSFKFLLKTYCKSVIYLLKIIYKFSISFFQIKSNGYLCINKSILFTVTSVNQPHLLNIIKPLILENRKHDAILFCDIHLINFKPLQNTKLLDWNSLKYFDQSAWRDEFCKTTLKWRKVIRKLKYDNNIYIDSNLLIYLLLIQTQKLMIYFEFFRENRPIKIITEYDRNHNVSPLISVANFYNIPTFTFIHGVPKLNNNLYPFLAKNILCWGNFQYDIFKDLICDSQKLLVVGCHFVSIKKKIKKNNKNINIVYAVSGIDLLNTDCISDFCNIVLEFKFFNGFVKLHPSRNKSIFLELIEKFPSISFIEGNDMEYENIIQKQDILIANETTYAYDSLLNKSLVVIYTKDKLVKDSLNEELSLYAKVPIASNPKELNEILNLVINDKLFVENLNYERNKFINKYYDSVGDEALQKVLNKLEL